MPSLLPPTRRPRLENTQSRLTDALLERLDVLLLLIPAGNARAELEKLPCAGTLLAQFDRRERPAGSVFSARLPNATQTLVRVGLLPAAASSFATLELCGALCKAISEEAPRRLGVLAAGLPAAAETAAIDSATAAIWAATFCLPSFKSQDTAAAPVGIVPITRRKLDRQRLTIVAEGTDMVRWFTAMPPDRLHPGAYRRAAQQLARRHGLTARFHGEAALKRMGAGAFLAVTRGSPRRDAGILHLRYRPRATTGKRPIALVGKGLCFDTGGTNLKSHKSMLDMHTDMSGSAVALAAIVALARLGYDHPVDAWLALAENRIGADAYQPQDVVTAMNGTTIQVIHTDAEGRMVLADTLALASRSRPAAIIDFATLTGACVTALTDRYSGAFTADTDWRPGIERAGQQSGERVWCMPVDDDFDKDLESKVADVIQCRVDGHGDHIYAARFLKRFVAPGIPWLHVDLSAATRAGGLAHVPTDVTGFGLRFVTSLLLDEALPGKGAA